MLFFLVNRLEKVICDYLAIRTDFINSIKSPMAFNVVGCEANASNTVLMVM